MTRRLGRLGLSFLIGWGLLLSLNLPLGFNSPIGRAMAAPDAQMQPHSATPSQFERIEQPLPVKLGVTAAGLGLIGLELWWFLVSKPKPKAPPQPVMSAETQQGI